MKKKAYAKFLTAAVAAAILANTSVFADENIKVNIDGSEVVFADQNPVIVDNRTLVPLSGIFEAMGADVSWSSEDKTVTIIKGETVISITIGNSIMKVNEEEIQLDALPQIINGRTMVPVRAISESIGAVVNWDSASKTVGIKTAQESEASDALAVVDSSKWQFNEEDNVYWQIGINYCSSPVDEEYETLGIFVPANYMDASDNGDGTFTCSINTSEEVNGYTSATAPIVIPINTPGYSSMKAPADYVSSASEYTDAGFIYINAGCRGRNEGAPAGITDLKAAVRYIRYSSESIPGSTDRIFTFGMSGGGAQSALMGATGNSDLYTPYLEAIGAVSGYSDAVAGSMCWCPITNLDYANEAYEWNMGITRADLDEETQALSDNMAKAYADYINSLELKDENGNILSLTESDSGIYQAGSYYEYVKSVIENSLNNFLQDTEFPYSPSSGKGGMGMMTGGGHGGNMPDGAEGLPEGDVPGELSEGGMAENVRIEDIDGINRTETSGSSETEQKTYNTAEEYIADLNSSGEWIIYDSSSNTASITSVEDFVKNCKKASKSVGAFDDLNRSQGENTLFGYGDGEGAHFDPVMAELLIGTEYEDDYASDLEKVDSLGNTVDVRMNMYNPMYYIEDSYDGYKTSDTAKYWRIRTGINQGDTALSTEINLALALEAYGGISVDFETVWAKEHVEAERQGDSSVNFIDWVNSCLTEE